MSVEATKYRVNVAGQTYVFVSDEPEAYIMSAAAHIEKILQEVRAKAPVLDFQKAVILAALHMALDLIKIQQKQQKEHAHLIGLVDYISLHLVANSPR